MENFRRMKIPTVKISTGAKPPPMENFHRCKTQIGKRISSHGKFALIENIHRWKISTLRQLLPVKIFHQWMLSAVAKFFPVEIRTLDG